MPGEKKPSVKTKYHVLRLISPAHRSTSDSASAPGVTRNAGYELVAENLLAHGSEHAVSVYAEKEKATLGESAILVAVPSRSWKPRSVKVETEVRVRVGAK